MLALLIRLGLLLMLQPQWFRTYQVALERQSNFLVVLMRPSTPLVGLVMLQMEREAQTLLSHRQEQQFLQVNRG